MSELLEGRKVKRWTTAEYLKIAETGVFDGQRLELIGGEICAMTPMNEPHAVGTDSLVRIFNRRLPETLWVRGQAPIYIGDHSAPEPDIAIVDAQIARDYERPTTAHLIVEVSDATLRYDQTTKASLYASAQITDYWIVNLQERTLEIYRRPVEDAAHAFGWKYWDKFTFAREQSVSPLCAPELSLTVGDFLP